jgi:uncharacterized protein YecE (DUF72 family)
MMAPLRVGTAGWNVPKAASADFAPDGPVLARYASRFRAVEINSSFYRPHRKATYERWSEITPDDFTFAVKAPRQVTHKQRLVDAEDLLTEFREAVSGLGRKLGPVLIQLPPSLAFDDQLVGSFFETWRALFDGFTVCEPRHPSWFTGEADHRLVEANIARVAADPAVAPGAAEPGGFMGCAYYRLHGSPVMYASAYGPDRLDALAGVLATAAATKPTWCIFDNTMYGAATTDALALIADVAKGRRNSKSRQGLKLLET